MNKQKGSTDQLEDIVGPKTDWPIFENMSSEPWLPAHSLELFIYCESFPQIFTTLVSF